jgi:hypothetical protein
MRVSGLRFGQGMEMRVLQLINRLVWSTNLSVTPEDVAVTNGWNN